MRTLLMTALLAALPVAAAETFSFAAIGDMPYNIPGDYAKFDRLIARINAAQPAFTVHVGDVKSGSTPCTDENILKVRDMFGSFAGPLIYTPGDNEWTDCHREKAGKFDPLERLAFVRKSFFPDNLSLGGQKMTLEQQSSDPKYATFVENTRWEKGGVTFATLHVIGSNNNLQRDAAAVNEYLARNAADLAWLDSTFQKATDGGAKAVVLFMQADPRFDKENDTDGRSGFNDLLADLRAKVTAFGKPVLLVHGDSHTFLVDRPWAPPGASAPVLNLTRLEVFGESNVQGTLVTVDTQDPDVFSFKALTVPENVTPAK